MQGGDEFKTAQEKEQHLQVRGIRRVVYLLLALLCFLLGMIGVVLPGLPTTPFLLFMSYFLIRSWPDLHERLIAWPVVGAPIREWAEHRGVRLHIKVIACCMVAVLVSFSVLSQQVLLPWKLAIGAFATIGIIVIWKLPTIR